MNQNFVVRHLKDVINYKIERCVGGVGPAYVAQILGYDPLLPMPGFPEDSKVIHYVHITTLPKGSSTGEHVHDGNEEFYLVMQGTGEMVVNGKIYPVKRGSIGLVRNGASHGMKNIGEDDLVMVVVEVNESK